MSPKTGVISTVAKQGGRKRKLGPIIVNFEHAKVDPDSFQSFRAGLAYEFPEDKPNTQPDLQVVVESKNLTYSNITEAARERRSNPYTKTLLVVRNKATKEVRLVETNSVTLSAEVNFPPTSNLLLKEEAEKAHRLSQSINVTETIQDERNTIKKHLIREFGQSKGRRMAEQSERLKIDDMIKHEKLKAVAETVDSSALMLPEQLTPELLTPYCNRAAKQIEDAYNLTDILTEDELALAEGAAVTLLNDYTSPDLVDESVQKKEITQVFGAILKRHLNVQDTRLLGAALFMEAIFQYLKMRPSSVTKAGPRGLPNYIPMALRQKVFDKFVPNTVVSQEGNDRAFCHALVLAFLANNFSIDQKLLSATIYMKPTLMKKLVQVTGATIRTDDLTRQSFVVLKLPLVKFDPALSLKAKAKKN